MDGGVNVSQRFTATIDGLSIAYVFTSIHSMADAVITYPHIHIYIYLSKFTGSCSNQEDMYIRSYGVLKHLLPTGTPDTYYSHPSNDECALAATVHSYK
jgi:hypothetical protein